MLLQALPSVECKPLTIFIMYVSIHCSGKSESIIECRMREHRVTKHVPHDTSIFVTSSYIIVLAPDVMKACKLQRDLNGTGQQMAEGERYQDNTHFTVVASLVCSLVQVSS